MTGPGDRFADLPGPIRLCYRTHGDPGGEPPPSPLGSCAS